MKEIVKNLESTDVQMREKVTNLENKVTELEAKNAQQDSLLSDLLREKNERTAAANHFEFAQIVNEGKRGQRHGFDDGDIHGPTTWNLFLLLHGTCALFSFKF